MVSKAQPPSSSFMDSIQAEVTTEASPLLDFLSEHAKVIMACIVAFICLIGVYFFYESWTEKARMEEQMDYGKIYAIKDPATRLEKLEGYVATAPKNMQFTAYLDIVHTAQALNKPEEVFTAWEKIRSLQPDFFVEATAAMAKTRMSQANTQEALALYEEALAKASSNYKILIGGEIASIAEITQDYARAITACKTILNEPMSAQNADFWSQRLAMFERELAKKQ